MSQPESTRPDTDMTPCARLVDEATGDACVLSRVNLLGRDPVCEIWVPDTTISEFHALLRWRVSTCGRYGAWWLRDLGSKNKTAILATAADGESYVSKLLGGGESHRLDPTTRFRLGPSRAFSLEASSAPPLTAVRTTARGRTVKTGYATILLPSDDDPDVVVCLDPEHGAVVAGEETHPVRGGSVVVRDEQWRIIVPRVPTSTVRVQPQTRVIFRVQAQGESCWAYLPGHDKPFMRRGSSVSFVMYTLLQEHLALSRGEPTEDPDGWMCTKRMVQSGLASREQMLNGIVCKVRGDFVNAGLPDPFERLHGCSLIRLNRRLVYVLEALDLQPGDA